MALAVYKVTVQYLFQHPRVSSSLQGRQGELSREGWWELIHLPHQHTWVGAAIRITINYTYELYATEVTSQQF